ncbi:SIR2 family protein [Gallibacterium anatis]|uniref:SIR2 family protein n=1 Tax=Gallibacterium anatis TaxID=750 RepID=A0A837CWD2_9PAST|nr:SIR2 family protein [Gallibacterium anatis]KGQ28243.1 hypothetical protein JP27_03880 [Gallibacterium anatis]HJF74986.1 SIR2 family protein [Gallibacterium anatis]
MKSSYLKRKFDDELNNKGKILIEGFTFYRDQILKELEPIGYDEIFNNWVEERKRKLLNAADEILDLFDNRERFERLKELYKKKRLIPFIGAGLSQPSGLPLWGDFLKKVHKETDIEKKEFNQLLADGNYEEVAELLEKNECNYLQEQLENTFGKNFNFEDLSGVVCRLPLFFPDASIITTNYDDIIKCVYEFYQKNFRNYISGLNYSSFQEQINNGEQVLLKLHGTYKSKYERVLTSSDYERHYNENNHISNCIRALFSQSVLFLGCSLNQDRTIIKLKEIVQTNTSSLPKHYAFLSCNDISEEERKAKRRMLNDANIYTIWYEGDHDECIEALLEKLAE